MATTKAVPPLTTADLVRMAEEWAGLRLGNAEDGGRRAELLVRLLDPANPFRSMYNAARFCDFVRTAANVSLTNVLMRTLQAEAERHDQ